MSKHRLDTTLGAFGVLTPIAVLVTIIGYSRDRIRAAWDDERGLSETVQIAVWAGIAVVATLAVAGTIVLAVRSRATDVGNDIENSNLP